MANTYKDKYMEVIKVPKMNNKRIFYTIAIIIFIIYIGFVFVVYGSLFNKIVVNILKSSNRMKQYEKLKDNTSCSNQDITVTIKSISTDTERVHIIIDVNKENLNSTRIPELENEFIKLTDHNGEQYELLSWGGACEGSKRTDNVEETKLEFQGYQ